MPNHPISKALSPGMLGQMSKMLTHRDLLALASTSKEFRKWINVSNGSEAWKAQLPTLKFAEALNYEKCLELIANTQFDLDEASKAQWRAYFCKFFSKNLLQTPQEAFRVHFILAQRQIATLLKNHASTAQITKFFKDYPAIMRDERTIQTHVTLLTPYLLEGQETKPEFYQQLEELHKDNPKIKEGFQYNLRAVELANFLEKHRTTCELLIRYSCIITVVPYLLVTFLKYCISMVFILDLAATLLFSTTSFMLAVALSIAFIATAVIGMLISEAICTCSITIIEMIARDAYKLLGMKISELRTCSNDTPIIHAIAYAGALVLATSASIAFIVCIIFTDTPLTLLLLTITPAIYLLKLLADQLQSLGIYLGINSSHVVPPPINDTDIGSEEIVTLTPSLSS